MQLISIIQGFLLAACFEFLVMTQNLSAQEWWKSTTVYQVYPRSFYDSNGDGIGDLQGVIDKLDHIKELGFETIWLSPFFKSPQQDFGYDISDYQDIAPEYGDMRVCEKLIDEVHKRGMKIIFDLVMNHTSIKHPWFKESASSRGNPKADWYVWRDGKGKRPPNNWKSVLGGSGWTYHKGRKQFYYAAFLPFQPDLNYHNPEVKAAMFDMVRFWLKKGVDGFRLDMFNAVYEDTSFQDNPFLFRLMPSEDNPNGFFQEYKYNLNQEKSFEFATELRSVIDEFDNPKRFLVGEVFGDNKTIKRFCSHNDHAGLNTVFLFQTLSTKFNAEDFRKMVESFEENFPEPFVPTYVFSNHDRARSFSRLGGNIEKARLLAFFQFTVRGVPFTYNGEELGMSQSKIPLREGKDPLAQRFKWLPQFLVNWSGQSLNRDECRTPMLWNDKPNAGFCPESAEPWLPVSCNYEEINAERQKADESSLLNFYQKIILLRNQIPALQSGRLEIAEAFCNKKILAFYRTTSNEKYLVVLNMSKKQVEIPSLEGEIAFSTHANPPYGMSPFEGRLIKIQ